MRKIASLGPAILFLVCLPPQVWAQQDMSRWEDLFSQHASEFRVKYGITPYVEEPVKGQGTEFSLIQQDLWASGQIWRDEHDEVSLHGGLRYQEIHTGAVLPDTGNPFPEHLWNVSLGATYRYLFENSAVLGGSVHVGSASDQPFHSSREIVESLTAFCRLPSGDRDAWLFFLTYGNNRDYANSVPIPGVEYLYHPSREFHAMVGFPIESLEWSPLDDLSFKVQYSIIHHLHALITYRLEDPLRVYAGFDWSTQSYLLAGRPDSKDRFSYDEKRAKTGLKLALAQGWDLDLSGGYAFDRSYRESQHGLRSAFDRVDIGNGFYGLATFEIALGRFRDRREARSKEPRDKTD